MTTDTNTNKDTHTTQCVHAFLKSWPLLGLIPLNLEGRGEGAAFVIAMVPCFCPPQLHKEAKWDSRGLGGVRHLLHKRQVGV